MATTNENGVKDTHFLQFLQFTVIEFLPTRHTPKIFNIGLSYPMGGNRVEAFEGNLRFLEEAAIVTSSW